MDTNSYYKPTYHAAYYQENRERIGAKNAAWRARNPDEPRRSHLRRTYGITMEQYDAMLEAQGGVCAICGRPEDELGRGGKVRSLAVDHDHVTGKIRGLLCSRCNKDLGIYEARQYELAAFVARTV